MTALPQLPDEHWAVLNYMTDYSAVTLPDIKRDALNVAVSRLRAIIHDLTEQGYVSKQANLESWLLTDEGNRVVKSRKVLLDPDTLAERLAAITSGMKRILDSGINRRAVVVLLHDSTRVNKTDIEKVLDGLSEIERNYCK